MNYIFSNIIGIFIFDEKFGVIDKVFFDEVYDYKNKNNAIKIFKEKYRAEEPKNNDLRKILAFFKSQNFYNDFYKKNIGLTKIELKNSVKFDILLIQSTNAVSELNIIINKLSAVLREWYGLYNPELSRKIESHEKFANLILNKNKKELLNEINIDFDDSMGAELDDFDLKPINDIAQQIKSLFIIKNNQEKYIESIMKKNCPNVNEVAGPLLGAKLIWEAGSLKRLSELPASTVQIFGAEKALFRHMKTGAKMPKHGIIVQHPLISKSQQRMHGKIARALADKLSIAAKVDYFKGNFVGSELKNSLIKKFGIEY